MAWTQNRRTLGVYLLPLQYGQDMDDDRVAGSNAGHPFLTPAQLISVIDSHHERLINYYEKSSSFPSGIDTSPLRRAKIFPGVIVIWMPVDLSPAREPNQAPHGEHLPTTVMDHVRQKGALVMLNLNLVGGLAATWQNSTRDAYLAQLGTDMGNWMTSANSTGNSDKGWAKRNEIVLRMNPECNELPFGRPDYPDWGAARYKDAVTKVHDKLSTALDAVQSGLSSKLKIMIHVTNVKAHPAQIANWVPANAKWDILGLSIYQRKLSHLDTSLPADVRACVQWAADKHDSKPVWLAEVGIRDAAGVNNVMRGRWMKNGYRAIQQHTGLFKRVKAFLYSDYTDAADKDWRFYGTAFDSIATVHTYLADRPVFQQDNPFEE